MAEYFISALIVSGVLSFITYLSYRSNTGGEMKLAVSILLLYTLATPILSFVSEGAPPWQMPSLDGDDLDFSDGEYQRVAEEAFCLGVKHLIAQKYGADEEDMDVTVRGFSFTDMRAERINVYLFGKASVLDFRGIQNYITEQGLGECEVFIDLG